MRKPQIGYIEKIRKKKKERKITEVGEENKK